MKARMRVLGAISVFALLASGCGKLTINSWVKVISDQSSGSIQSDPIGPNPFPINRLQGGFLGDIVVDTSKLPAPLDGTVGIGKVEIAGDTNGPAGQTIIGQVCVWGDPNNPSNGTIHLDLLGGNSSTTLNLNLKATATIAQTLHQPPVFLSQSQTVPLAGIGIAQLISASQTGSADGLFAATTNFTGNTTVGGLPATFTLNLSITNQATPPLFDADLLKFCGPHFNEQGKDIFYGINSKSSYLTANKFDNPQPPLIIPLADIGAKPGDRLLLARVGTYDDKTELKDGKETRVGAVFSSSDTVLTPDQNKRVPDAIASIMAPSVVTGSFQVSCFLWPFCTVSSTDILQDFTIANSPTVLVPFGAQFLIVGTLPPSNQWGDNSGFGLGVDITVNP